MTINNIRYGQGKYTKTEIIAKMKRVEREYRAKKVAPSPPKTHLKIPVENGFVKRFGVKSCKVCSGTGVMRKQQVVEEFETRKNKKGGTYQHKMNKKGKLVEEQLCSCALKRVMEIPGVIIDELDGNMYLTSDGSEPAEAVFKELAAMQGRLKAVAVAARAPALDGEERLRQESSTEVVSGADAAADDTAVAPGDIAPDDSADEV